MDALDLTTFNLNLLVALDALLTEQNVTRAAKRIGITQSAMSHNLATLRQLLGDQILVRSAGGMEPTVVASEMSGRLRSALDALKAAVELRPTFDPRTARRQFRIAAHDFVAAELSIALNSALAAEAPGVDVAIRPIEGRDPASVFFQSDIDVVVGKAHTLEDIRQELLIRDDFVCVARRGHPEIQETIDLDQYCASRHIIVSPTGEGSSFVDVVLEQRGRSRTIALRVPWFLAAPIVVSQSDLLLTALRGSVEGQAKGLGLRLLPVPFETPRIDVTLGWHRRHDDDPAQHWLRQTILRCVRRPSSR